MEIQRISRPGFAFIADEEGCVLRPYKDSVGIATIGYGCTYYENGKRVQMSDPPITKARALTLFKNLLVSYEKAVWSRTRDDINQNQFDALTSLCFNIGVQGFRTSTVLKRVNHDPNDPKIKQAFMMWRFANGRAILSGRRLHESNLYFS